MLKNLKVTLDKTQHHEITSHDNPGITYSIQNGNVEVTCNIVDHIFRHIDICLKEDKSKIKISLFTKSFIRGMLTNDVKNGINNFILNMNDQEVKLLLDDIQKELDKRHK